MEIITIPLPHVCKGFLLKRSEDDIEASTYPVYIYQSPMGDIDNITCQLSYNPGSEENFKENDHVMVLVTFEWDSQDGYKGVIGNLSPSILGAHSPENITKFNIRNPNADLEGIGRSFLDPDNKCGMIVEKSGAVHLVTDGLVTESFIPRGNAINENLKRSFAQNFIKIIADEVPFYRSREHFGLYNGENLQDKVSKAVDPANILISYRRFVAQSRDPNKWVSTNEGAYSPWVGDNNDSYKIEKNREIIYNKIINYNNSRITVHSGEEGPGFLVLRIDKIADPPLKGEKIVGDGPAATPVISDNVFYMGISDEGEALIEFAKEAKPGGKAAATIRVNKAGEIDIDVGSVLRINGQPVLLKKFMDFFVSHQFDLVQTAGIGTPAPMSPSAGPELATNSKTKGEYLSDKKTNDLTGSAPKLEST